MSNEEVDSGRRPGFIARPEYRTQFKDSGAALAYLTDCTLSTVCNMACKKNRKKHEYERQISIAQTAVDALKQFGVDYAGTRVVDVDEHGSVREWARSWESRMVLPHAQLVMPGAGVDV